MRNKRTSKKQAEMYSSLKQFIKRKFISKNGVVIESDDLIEARTKNIIMTLELEKRVPESRYSCDLLLTIQDIKNDREVKIDIEYDGLHWHRKWNDEKKNDVLMKNGISLIRIQTFGLSPSIPYIWKLIKELFSAHDTNIIYYRLPDFDEDVWTGKRFLHYLDSR